MGERIVSPGKKACLALALLFCAAPAFASPLAPVSINSNEGVSVSELSSPSADTFGVPSDKPDYPSVSWKGSQPASIENLLITLPSPIQTPPQKALLLHLLTLPVPPSERESVPADWLALRLRVLYTLGADDAAAKLVTGIPANLTLPDSARREGTDALLRTHHLKEACKLANPAQDEQETPDMFWSTRLTFCHYINGEIPQAELGWQLAHENHGHEIGKLSAALFDQWAIATATLPPLTQADSAIEPLLIAALDEDEKTHLSTRIGENFLTSESISTISPALAARLMKNEAIPPVIRFELAEKAASYGLITPGALREQYNSVAANISLWDKLPPEANLRLQAVQRLQHIPEGSTQIAEMEKAIPLFAQKFGDDITYRFFADQMDLLHEGLDSLKPGVSLALDAASDDLSHNNTDGAETIASYLKQSGLPEGQAAAMLIELSLRLQRGEKVDTISFDALPENERSSWMAMRTAQVFQALGAKVNYPAVSGNAISPLVSTPPSNIIDRLRFAKANHLAAETLLASALLLPSGSLRQVSDATSYEIVHNLETAGFHELARTFAIQFLLHAPAAAH